MLDGFAGSGMTAVAAQWCGAAPAAYRYELEAEWKKAGRERPQWGARRAIVGDLSPAATFIAAGYNLPFDVTAFEKAAKRLLGEVENEIGWMYKTLHVEPASSRLIQQTGFQKPTGIEPAASGLSGRRTEGISEFTARRDNLPHWQSPGAFYFLTFNTSQHRELSPGARDIVAAALRHWHGERLQLIAAVVMPDHVHALIQPLEKLPGVWWDLAELLHSIKSYSANEINKLDDRRGEPVWQTESYDRIVRDEREYGFVLQYIAWNPIRQGLCDAPEEYRWWIQGEGLRKAGWKPAHRAGSTTPSGARYSPVPSARARWCSWSRRWTRRPSG